MGVAVVGVVGVAVRVRVVLALHLRVLHLARDPAAPRGLTRGRGGGALRRERRGRPRTRRLRRDDQRLGDVGVAAVAAVGARRERVLVHLGLLGLGLGLG